MRERGRCAWQLATVVSLKPWLQGLLTSSMCLCHHVAYVAHVAVLLELCRTHAKRLAPSTRTHTPCGGFLLQQGRSKTNIELHPRASPARLIDTFAFGSASELEELRLRFYEMGEEVSEFHIVEGDRDFTGTKKPYEFDTVLSGGKLDRWKDKITYHKAKIPEGVKGYALQEVQRLEVMNKHETTEPRP